MLAYPQSTGQGNDWKMQKYPELQVTYPDGRVSCSHDIVGIIAASIAMTSKTSLHVTLCLPIEYQQTVSMAKS